MPTDLANSRETRWQHFRSRWKNLDATVKWIICAAVIGYIPVFGAELLRRIFKLLMLNTDELSGFGLAWGLGITVPCTLVIVVLVVYEILRSLITTFRKE